MFCQLNKIWIIDLELILVDYIFWYDIFFFLFLQRLVNMKVSFNCFVSVNFFVNKFKNRLVNILLCKYYCRIFFLVCIFFQLIIYVLRLNFKNKFLFLVEFIRVVLQFIRGVDGLDYINVSFIDVSLKFVCIFIL